MFVTSFVAIGLLANLAISQPNPFWPFAQMAQRTNLSDDIHLTSDTLQTKQFQPASTPFDVNPVVNLTSFDVRAIPKENLNETDERKNHTAMLDFGDSMNSFITTSVALLGAALGRSGCDLKAACLAATYIPNIQGRDIAVLAAEPLIPAEWKAAYEAAKFSIIQRQDCNRFSCF